MYNFAENLRRILEPALGIGVSRVHNFVGHHQNLFNFPLADDIVS